MVVKSQKQMSVLACALLLTFLSTNNVLAADAEGDILFQAVTADACDDLLCCAMILFSMYSGRGIFLDIALIGALLGIVDTMLVGRYLEGRL